jgi:hypothetical protein
MGTEVLAATAIIGVVASAASAGIAYYGQQQQADTASRMANYNAAIQRQNADVQVRMAQYQAGVNANAANAEAQARLNNAASIANQATGVEAQQREKARRLRIDQERQLALQRGKFAKAGVVNEGSPLVVLAETARLTELNIQDSAYESELERQSLLRKSEMERFQSGFSLLDASQAQYQGAIAGAQHRIAYREADLTRMAGNAAAQSYRNKATGSLISGLSSTASGATSAYRSIY